MQRSSRILVPICKTFRNAGSVQPSRTFFSRRSMVPISYRFSDHFRDMERQFERMERDISAAFCNPWTRVVVPTYSRYSSVPMTIYESETPGKYTVNVVIGESVPAENVKVTLTDRVVKIEAKYEHKAEDGQSSISQELMRQFTLPENVDLSQVKSFYTGDGILKIEGPLPIEESANEKFKEIPIKIGETKGK